MIAGLTADNKPFLSSMDCLGCEMMTKDFVVAGTMEDALYGMCESLYRPDLVRVVRGSVSGLYCGGLRSCSGGVLIEFALNLRLEQEPEDLFETLSQCLLSACNRDALAGWGGVVHIITPKGVTSKKLKSRQD